MMSNTCWVKTAPGAMLGVVATNQPPPSVVDADAVQGMLVPKRNVCNVFPPLGALNTRGEGAAEPVGTGLFDTISFTGICAVPTVYGLLNRLVTTVIIPS